MRNNSRPVLAPPAQFRAMACASFDSYDFPRRSLSTALLVVLAHNIHSKKKYDRLWKKVLEKQNNFDFFTESVVQWCHMRWQGSKLLAAAVSAGVVPSLPLMSIASTLTIHAFLLPCHIGTVERHDGRNRSLLLCSLTSTHEKHFMKTPTLMTYSSSFVTSASIVALFQMDIDSN